MTTTATQPRKSKTRLLELDRTFSSPTTKPFDQITWERRSTSIGDGKTIIFQQDNVEIPTSWSLLATKIVVSKYFYGDISNGTNPSNHGRESSVRQLIDRVATAITKWGVADGYFNNVQADIFHDELTWLLVNQYGAFNSPVWFNVGLYESYGIGKDGQKGNWVYNPLTDKAQVWNNQYEYPQASACFIQGVDDTMESIMELARSEAMLFKYGSGTGSDLSTLRSTREKLSGGGKPSGPMSFLRIWDQVAGTIKSGGKTRRAAKMNTLKTWHPDIEEFIDAKSTEEKKAWALIEAGYDGSYNGNAYGSVMYQNENLSVRATDEFMDKSMAPEGDADGNYFTKRVTDGKDCEIKNARTLLRKIAEGTHLCGDPGMQFEDTIHTMHTCKGTGRQNSTNPCCFTGDTLVDTSEGFISIEALEVADRQDQLLPLAFSFDFDDNLPVLKQIRKVWVAGETANLIEVRTDKGITLRCTPEHRFYLYDGTAVEAQDLVPEMRLRKIARWENEARGNRRHINHRETASSSNGTSIMSRWMWEQANEPIPEGMEVHHKNGNRQDDRVSNFELKPTAEHRSEHSSGSTNPRFIEVSDARLLEVWEALESATWAGSGQQKPVTIARWNKYVRDHGLQGQVPIGRYDKEDAGRIQGLSWSLFEQAMRDAKCAANDRILSVRAITLDEPVKVYDMEVEDTHNFGVLSPGNLHSIIVSNSEYLFLDNTACNLASLNLLKFKMPDGSFDAYSFEKACRIFITAQEILVDRASYPTQQIAENSHIFRTLGLGFANLGALIMSYGLGYDSDEGRAMAGAITALMTGTAYAQSAYIASVKDAFPGYRDARCSGVDNPEKPDNVDSMADVIALHRDACVELCNKMEDAPAHYSGIRDIAFRALDQWDVAVMAGDKHGYRNAQVTVLAPTGTIGFLMDCDTTGIEPDIALVKYKELAGGGHLKIVNQTVESALLTLAYSKVEIERILKHIDTYDTIEDVGTGSGIVKSGLRAEHLPVFDCAFKAQQGTRSLHYMGHLRMMAACQPFLSGAISKTVNLPETASVDDIVATYTEGWKLGLKAIAIYRDGSKRSAPLSTKAGGFEKAATAADPEVVEQIKELENYIALLEQAHGEPVRKKLPDTRNAKNHKFEVGGHKGYLNVGLFDNGQPGEIFISMSKEGSTIGGLMDTVATLTSISLQYGVPLASLVKKFAFQRFEPSGFTKNQDIRNATSIIDYVFRWLACEFIPGYREELRPVAHQPVTMGPLVLPVVRPIEDIEGPAETKISPFLPDPCANCGSSKVVRSGVCGVCTECGTSAGCS